MTEELFALAVQMGAVSEREQALLPALCQAAHEELSGRLREGVTQGDCGQAFPVAGAWLALAALEVARSSGQVESFTAGALTIKQRGGAEGAQKLREQAERLMAPYLADGGFSFQGVEG